MKCPVCDYESPLSVNTDAMICSQHGAISGLEMLQLGAVRGLDAGIELNALRAQQEISVMCWQARSRIGGQA